MKIYFNLLVICILLTQLSCSTYKDKPNEKLVIYYNNGYKFCEGKYDVYESHGNEYKDRIGLWNFYHSNGKLEELILYDDEGEVLNYKQYRESGIIERSEIYDGVKIVYSEYNEIGSIVSEKVVIEEVVNEDGEEWTDIYTTIYTYYDNGQIKSQKEYENDELWEQRV